MSAFYDRLAPLYHLIYDDWEAAIASQADLYSGIIQSEWGPAAQSILDAACGIGTQSLGLAALGYRVTASDLSPGAVDRARKEAAARRLNISFSICDMRAIHACHGAGFDVVLCAGNSIPHLLNDSDILLALKEMYACLRPGGGCLIAIRPYDRELRGKNLLKPFGVRERGARRYTIFQIWDFDGDQYDFAMYFVEEDRQSGRVETHVMRSRYYAISPDHLMELTEQAGFKQVKRVDEAAAHPAILVGTR